MTAKQRKAAQAAQKALMTDGIALAVLFAAYKFAPHPAVKTASVALAAVVVGQRLPILGDAMA